MQATVSPISTLLDDAREAWQLKEAAAAQQAEQERVETERTKRARRAEQKAAFVERLTALWQEITGQPATIDDADLVHDGGGHWFWNLIDGLQVGVEAWAFRGQPPRTHLYLTRDNRTEHGVRFATLVELGQALAQFEDQGARQEQHDAQARVEETAHAEFARRQAAWEARRPALPEATWVLFSGMGGVIVQPGVYTLSLTPFTGDSQRTVSTISLDRDDVTRLLAVLTAGSGLFVDGTAHVQTMILLVPNSTYWFMEGDVWRTSPPVARHAVDTAASPLCEQLRAWLAFRAAHDVWRAEGEAEGFWFD